MISVAERLAPSVASLRVSRRVRGGRRLDGGGSAVVITPDGFLLTSAHVVASTDGSGRASFVDGSEHEFEVVGADPLSDLAVLALDRNGLSAAELGDAEGCASASSSSRSAARSASAARSRLASSRRSAARCRSGRPDASSRT